MDRGVLWWAGGIALAGLRGFSLESWFWVGIIVGWRWGVEAFVWVLLLIHGLLIPFALLTILPKTESRQSKWIRNSKFALDMKYFKELLFDFCIPLITKTAYDYILINLFSFTIYYKHYLSHSVSNPLHRTTKNPS